MVRDGIRGIRWRRIAWVGMVLHWMASDGIGGMGWHGIASNGIR